jgi:uncharacterized membrane protein
VLELKVPDLATAGSSPAVLGRALLQQWPSYVGLVTSFFTILIMWVHHHAILRNVCRTDAWLHFANGCLLLGVTFVPYPTSILATYLRTPAAKMAALFYSGTFVFIAMCFYMFIHAAFRKPLLSATASMEFVAKTCHEYMLGPPLYLVATVSALFRRAVVAGRLHSAVDFLGDNDYEEYAGGKAALSRTLVIGGDELAVFDVHLADVGRQPQLFTILGRVHEPLDGGFERRLRNREGAELAADGLEFQITVRCAKFADKLQGHILAVNIEDHVSPHTVAVHLNLYVFDRGAYLFHLVCRGRAG